MRRPRLDRPDALLIGWTMLAKVGVLVLGFIALWAVTSDMPGLLEPWHRWDAPHYTDIAIWGYMANDPGTLSYPGYRQDFPGDLDLYIVFFPLYPWLVGAANAVLGLPVVSAFLVSTLASLFVAPLLYRLVSVDLGHRVAMWAAAFMLVFPTAYFLHIGYTESLFLALSFGSLWLARTGRWWTAGIAGGLAALTRVNGLVLIPALAVEAFLQWRAHGRLQVRWVGALAGVALGFVAYLGLNLAVYGDPFAFSEIQRSHWFKDLSWPWEAVRVAVRWTGSPDADLALTYGWLELLFTVLGLAATIASAIWLRPTWTTWMAGNWLMVVSTGFLSSVPRYSLALFGIFVLSGLAAERWRFVGATLVAASVAGMVYLAVRFATNLWAF